MPCNILVPIKSWSGSAIPKRPVGSREKWRSHEPSESLIENRELKEEIKRKDEIMAMSHFLLRCCCCWRWTNDECNQTNGSRQIRFHKMEAAKAAKQNRAHLFWRNHLSNRGNSGGCWSRQKNQTKAHQCGRTHWSPVRFEISIQTIRPWR